MDSVQCTWIVTHRLDRSHGSKIRQAIRLCAPESRARIKTAGRKRSRLLRTIFRITTWNFFGLLYVHQLSKAPPSSDNSYNKSMAAWVGRPAQDGYFGACLDKVISIDSE
jgi:hypothetical protein